MKKVLLYILATVLFYGLILDSSYIKVLFMLAGLSACYAVYRLPSRYIIAAKYPVIFLSLAVTAGFLFYPHVQIPDWAQVPILCVGFYGLGFYLIAMDEKKKGLFKEIVALSIIFASSAFNAAMMGKGILILPMGLAIMLFLFILGRHRILPLMAAYLLAIALLLYGKGVVLFGPGPVLQDIHRYLLLGATLLLLVIGFMGTVKQVDYAKLLSFFGVLYLSLDVLMTVGLKLSGGLLYQPVLSLIIVAPILGLMLKPSGGRA